MRFLWVLLFFFGSAMATTVLSPEQAFQFRANRSGDQVVLNWNIAPGHYLYKERIEMKAAPDVLQSFHLPKGMMQHDELQGDYETYQNTLRVVVPLKDHAKAFDLKVRYQGCSKAGVCYPFVEKQLLIGAGVPSLFGSTQTMWILSAAFLAGILLAFTPCVFPMYPILSSMLVGPAVSTRKAFSLSLAYVFSIALTYATVGLLSVRAGHALQIDFQHPWVLMGFAVLLMLMALSLFDRLHIRLPSRWSAWVHQKQNTGQKGTYKQAILMGMLSILVASPCVSPVLVSVLAYVAHTQNYFVGGMSLFLIAFGMGLPLVLLGTSLGRFLPRSGAWMVRIKHVFGWVLMGFALTFCASVVPLFWMHLVWAVFGYAMFLWALSQLKRPVHCKALQVMGLVLVLGVGVFSYKTVVPHQKITTWTHLQSELKKAKGTLHVIDVVADWCVSCRRMEKAFEKASVQNAWRGIHRMKMDITHQSQDTEHFMKAYHVVAPPTLIFFDKHGVEYARWVGERSEKELLKRPKP